MFDVERISDEDARILEWYPPLSLDDWEAVGLLVLETEVFLQTIKPGKYGDYRCRRWYYTLTPDNTQAYIRWDRFWKSSSRYGYIDMTLSEYSPYDNWVHSQREVGTLYPEYLYLKGVILGV